MRDRYTVLLFVDVDWKRTDQNNVNQTVWITGAAAFQEEIQYAFVNAPALLSDFLQPVQCRPFHLGVRARSPPTRKSKFPASRFNWYVLGQTSKSSSERTRFTDGGTRSHMRNTRVSEAETHAILFEIRPIHFESSNYLGGGSKKTLETFYRGNAKTESTIIVSGPRPAERVVQNLEFRSRVRTTFETKITIYTRRNE